MRTVITTQNICSIFIQFTQTNLKKNGNFCYKFPLASPWNTNYFVPLLVGVWVLCFNCSCWAKHEIMFWWLTNHIWELGFMLHFSELLDWCVDKRCECQINHINSIPVAQCWTRKVRVPDKLDFPEDSVRVLKGIHILKDFVHNFFFFFLQL